MPDPTTIEQRVAAALTALRANRANGDTTRAQLNEQRLNTLLEQLATT
jgi:hypothetical protein